MECPDWELNYKNKVQESRRRMVSGTVDAGVTATLAKIHGRALCWAMVKIPDGQDSGYAIEHEHATTGDDDQDFAALLEKLPEDQPRWIVIDFHYLKNEVNNNKILFLMYVPDACNKLATKFAYANYKEGLKA